MALQAQVQTALIMVQCREGIPELDFHAVLALLDLAIFAEFPARPGALEVDGVVAGVVDLNVLADVRGGLLGDPRQHFVGCQGHDRHTTVYCRAETHTPLPIRSRSMPRLSGIVLARRERFSLACVGVSHLS
jgi:hypothetical protein